MCGLGSPKEGPQVYVFDQVIDGVLYTQILNQYLLIFIQKQFLGTEYCFMQDKDPKHTSSVAKDFYQAKGINWWPTPASSADFNPIDRV